VKSKLLHLSVAVQDPKRCAEILAELTGGETEVFSPLKGSYVCLWGGWEGQFIEFYPAGTILKETASGCEFAIRPLKERSHGIHLNITTQKSLGEIQQIADKNNCPHHPRLKEGGPLYEVWLDERKLLVELVSDEIRSTIR